MKHANSSTRTSRQAERSSAALHPMAHLSERARAAVDASIGLSAISQIERMVRAVKNPQLHLLLVSVVIEPEVEQALTCEIGHSLTVVGRIPVYPVQALRRAAEMAAYWCAFGAQEREVLYVATCIRGIGYLLAGHVSPGADLNDIVFTLVRPALHRLDDSAPLLARRLRLALGWGNDDEVGAWGGPNAQESVARALAAVDIGPKLLPKAEWCQ